MRSDSAKKLFDLVLVDPPRTGSGPAGARMAGAAKPTVIVYVSCDPVTLARDSGELVTGGLRAAEPQGLRFYPQTTHVECDARFVLR